MVYQLIPSGPSGEAILKISPLSQQALIKGARSNPSSVITVLTRIINSQVGCSKIVPLQNSSPGLQNSPPELQKGLLNIKTKVAILEFRGAILQSRGAILPGGYFAAQNLTVPKGIFGIIEAYLFTLHMSRQCFF